MGDTSNKSKKQRSGAKGGKSPGGNIFAKNIRKQGTSARNNEEGKMASGSDGEDGTSNDREGSTFENIC